MISDFNACSAQLSSTHWPGFSPPLPFTFTYEDRLKLLCEKATNAPSYTKYSDGNEKLYLLAITQNSGGVFFKLEGKKVFYKQKEEGTMILGWGPSEGDKSHFHQITNCLPSAKLRLIWLKSEPKEIEGASKDLVEVRP